MHVYNNKRLMINFTENLTKVGASTSDGISSDRRKVKIRLTLRDRIEDLVLTSTNVFYLLNSLFNIFSPSFLSNIEIYYLDKDEILCDLKTPKTFAFAEQYKTNFYLHLLNLLAAGVNLLQKSKVYKKKAQM